MPADAVRPRARRIQTDQAAQKGDCPAQGDRRRQGPGQGRRARRVAAPCSVSVWRTDEGAVLFVADKVGSYVSDEADLPDGGHVDKGEGAGSIRTWLEKAAATY